MQGCVAIMSLWVLSACSNAGLPQLRCDHAEPINRIVAPASAEAMADETATDEAMTSDDEALPASPTSMLTPTPSDAEDNLP